MDGEEMAGRKAQRTGGGVGDNLGLSWDCSYAGVARNLELTVSERDRILLREIARRVREIASAPEQAQKRVLWENHNALEKTRPLLFCDPENAWYEIFPGDTLRCEGALARVWELRLRKEIYWAEKIRDDRVAESVFKIFYLYDETGRGLETRRIGGERDGAYTWEPPLRDYGDLEKLRPKKLAVDFEKSAKLFELACEVLGDILEVRLEGSWWWSLGMTSDAVFLRGLEQMLYDFYDYPEELHRLMGFLRDENLALLDALESGGLLSLNSGGDYVGTGGFGWSKELPQAGGAKKMIRTSDLWGYCESQETAGVSPELFEEFVFQYQLPILERFGLNLYGCCEPLDHRMDIIKRIPRLRKVTVSPWSDADAMAEKIGKDYIYTKKVNPADIAVSNPDEQELRKGLRKLMKTIAKNDCRAEILMRDILTLSWNPENAALWTRIAREEAEAV